MHQYVTEVRITPAIWNCKNLNIQKTELRPWHFFSGRRWLDFASDKVMIAATRWIAACAQPTAMKMSHRQLAAKFVFGISPADEDGVRSHQTCWSSGTLLSFI